MKPPANEIRISFGSRHERRAWSCRLRAITGNSISVRLDLALSSIYDCIRAQTNSMVMDRRMTNRLPDELDYPSSPTNAVMWYLIVSLPGTIILILGGGAFALYDPLGFLIVAFFWTLVCPGMWVFPIVFCTQVYNLRAGRFVPISGNTYICVMLLLGVYVWAGIATNFLLNMDY